MPRNPSKGKNRVPDTPAVVPKATPKITPKATPKAAPPKAPAKGNGGRAAHQINAAVVAPLPNLPKGPGGPISKLLQIIPRTATKPIKS